jgi:hypothetical protein
MLVSHTYIFEISPVEQGLDEPMVLSATLDRIVYYATRKVSPDIAVLFFFCFLLQLVYTASNFDQIICQSELYIHAHTRVIII